MFPAFFDCRAGPLGVTFEYGCDKQITRFSNVGATMVIGNAVGVLLRIRCEQQEEGRQKTPRELPSKSNKNERNRVVVNGRETKCRLLAKTVYTYSCRVLVQTFQRQTDLRDKDQSV